MKTSRKRRVLNKVLARRKIANTLPRTYQAIQWIKQGLAEHGIGTTEDVFLEPLTIEKRAEILSNMFKTLIPQNSITK